MCFHNISIVKIKFLFVLATHPFVMLTRSMMASVMFSISMKDVTLMVQIVAQTFIKLVIASATQKMTSKHVTMMVEIAV